MCKKKINSIPGCIVLVLYVCTEGQHGVEGCLKFYLLKFNAYAKKKTLLAQFPSFLQVFFLFIFFY